MVTTLAGSVPGAQVNSVALSLAQGLGEGASSAFNLTSMPTSSTPFKMNGLDRFAGNLGKGPFTSFLGGVSVKQLLSTVGGNITSADTNKKALALA